MIKNYVPAEVKTHVEFRVVFDDGEGTASYCFICTPSGEVVDLPEEAKENYQFCMEHPEEFSRWNEIERLKWKYREPARGTCICGEEVELYDQYSGACQCPNCGRWYNLFGQSLLPPDQWESDPSEEEYW